VHPILIRNLKRSFFIDAAWSNTPLAAVSTTPDMEGCAPPPEVIVVEPLGRFFRLTTPAGDVAAGTLCDLARRIDVAIMQRGFKVETDLALVLPAAILRTPQGERSAFIGGRASGLTWLCLSLLEAGWRFEGDGWAVVDEQGMTPLPRTIRVASIPPHVSPQFRSRIEASPTLSFSAAERMFTVDPRELGGDWKLTSGPIARACFLELNPGGFSGLRALGPNEAFARALALCHGKLTARSLFALRKTLSGAPAYRLRLGNAADAAALLS
jgi:hypothetical protein